MWQYQRTEELYHHGVLGMKWGRRRYQNPDGTLTAAGRKRLAKIDKDFTKVTGKSMKDVKVVTVKEARDHRNGVKSKKLETDPKKIPVDELKKRNNRMTEEINYTNNLIKTGRVRVKKKGVLKQKMKEAATNNLVNAGSRIMNHYLNTAITNRLNKKSTNKK